MRSNRNDADKTMLYQIRITGSLCEQWCDWFQGFSVVPTGDGDTLLTGPVADQAALYGLLSKVRDLGIPLISVNRIDNDVPEETEWEMEQSET